MLLNLFDDLNVFLLDVLAAPCGEHPSVNQPFQCLTLGGKEFVFIYLIYSRRCCPFPTTLFSLSSISTRTHRAKGFLQFLLLLFSPTLHPCGLALACGFEGTLHEMIHIFSSPHCLSSFIEIGKVITPPSRLSQQWERQDLGREMFKTRRSRGHPAPCCLA